MKKKILGHRGYSEIAPENTKLAFDVAYQFGFDGIEIDIHKTLDNEIVVIHDEKVNRTSNKKGYVKDFTFAELEKMNFSYRFNKKIPPQKIMKFKDFLEEYSSKFKIINVELKTDIERYEGLEEEVIKIHNIVNPKNKIIYSSFNFDSIKLMRSLSSKVILGFLFTESYELEENIDEVKNICQYIHPWFKTLLDKRSLSYYEDVVKLPMYAWTIDSNEVGDWWTAGSSSVISKLKRIKNLEGLISNSRI